MKIVGIVPAKGSSERLPSKNMKILGGEHLLRRKLIQMLESRYLSEVWLDTESEEIIQLAADLPVKIMKRDPALATNKTDGHAIFENECHHVGGADIVVQTLCTAPFVTSATVDRALQALINSPEHDSLVGIYTRKQYLWENGLPVYGSERIPNSVDLPTTCIEAMSLYAVRATSPLFPRFRIGKKPLMFALTAEETVDIDDLGDFELAQKIADAEILKEAQRFQVLKLGLPTAMVLDILKDMKLGGVLPQPIRPQVKGKILGRAKTLKLRAITTGEKEHAQEWRGIYKALSTYDYIRSGDIIVVASDVKERAYFGDLNAHLAIRSGAVGAIVDGMTRDVEDVRRFGFPVYARGTWCNDIKYEGTVEQMNMPVEIGECSIHNRDIILADEDGIVCIPARAWPEVLQRALITLKNEVNIRVDAMLGAPAREILAERGDF